MPKGADKLSIYTGGSERMFLDLQTPKKTLSRDAAHTTCIIDLH